MARIFIATVVTLFVALTSAEASPLTVTVVGDLQSELGCAGDWDPGCAATHLTYDAADNVWQGSFTLPAGIWQYKAAIDDSWLENYGANATPGGANITLSLAAPTLVKFFYSDVTHWITDNVNSVIATAPGSFQSEMGCPGDWDPGCLRSWLQDPDGDGVYTFVTSLPLGTFDAKVAINEDWIENYGLGGVPGGFNIPFAVTTGSLGTRFTYVASTHILTVEDLHPVAAVPEPASAILVATGLAAFVRRRARRES
jgi:hypothetical protein